MTMMMMALVILLAILLKMTPRSNNRKPNRMKSQNLISIPFKLRPRVSKIITSYLNKLSMLEEMITMVRDRKNMDKNIDEK